MKKFATTFASLLFAGSVGASDESFIYHGFEVNNPDLYAGYSTPEAASAVQPGVGDSLDRTQLMSARFEDSYKTYSMGNPDLYSGVSRSDSRTARLPGIGDSFDRSQGWSLSSSDSYDAWVKGNPDQESGF